MASKAYVQSYRPTGLIKPIFLSLKMFLKIAVLTFFVFLEALRPAFDLDFLSVYSYRSQKLMFKVTDQPDI